MKQKSDKKIFEAWEKRWEGSTIKERITPLGRRMFKAKKKTMARVLKEIKISTAVDVGCGLGYTLETLRDLGIHPLGIDVSSNAVLFCRKKGLNAVQKRMEDVEGLYDLVFSDGMLEHFLNFEPYAEQMMRLSHKYVLLIQPNHESFSGRTMAYLAGLFRGRTNVYEYNYRIRDFVEVFESGGYSLHENKSVYFNIFRLLLFKKNRLDKKKPHSF